MAVSKPLIAKKAGAGQLERWRRRGKPSSLEQAARGGPSGTYQLGRVTGEEKQSKWKSLRVAMPHTCGDPRRRPALGES